MLSPLANNDMKVNEIFTGLVPVVSVVAEWLTAEQVVTLKMTAHCLQEAQNKGSTGG